VKNRRSLRGPVAAPIFSLIDNVYLAWFPKGCPEKEDYLEPVYVFEGVCYGTRGNTDSALPFKEYVPALREVPPEWVS
jgi:hypothetical protein